MDHEELFQQKSGVLSFSLNGMGSSFFQDIPLDPKGCDKEVTVYYSITESKEPHHLAGLHQFRQKGEGASASQEEDEDEPLFSCKQIPIETSPAASNASSPSSSRASTPAPP